MNTKDCLIVIDVQNDFIDGVLGSEYAKAVVPAISNKVIEYINDGKIIFATLDTHTRGKYKNTIEGKTVPMHCEKGGHGWRMPFTVDFSGEIYKVEKSTFGAEELIRKLPEGYKSVEVVGLCTDICVISNVLMIRSMRPEIEIYVDAKCCAGSTTGRHAASLEVMKACGINVIES